MQSPASNIMFFRSKKGLDIIFYVAQVAETATCALLWSPLLSSKLGDQGPVVQMLISLTLG